MLRTAFILGLPALLFAQAGQAQENSDAPTNEISVHLAEAVLQVTQGYIECFQIRPDNEKRLSCYDDLLLEFDEVSSVLKGSKPTASKSCEIESWNFREKAGSAYITGSTTCAKGKLNYRLYRDEDGTDFLVSGFTFIDGFAFQTYADVGNVPSRMSIKYTIER